MAVVDKEIEILYRINVLGQAKQQLIDNQIKKLTATLYQEVNAEKAANRAQMSRVQGIQVYLAWINKLAAAQKKAKMKGSGGGYSLGNLGATRSFFDQSGGRKQWGPNGGSVQYQSPIGPQNLPKYARRAGDYSSPIGPQQRASLSWNKKYANGMKELTKRTFLLQMGMLGTAFSLQGLQSQFMGLGTTLMSALSDTGGLFENIGMSGALAGEGGLDIMGMMGVTPDQVANASLSLQGLSAGLTSIIGVFAAKVLSPDVVNAIAAGLKQLGESLAKEEVVKAIQKLILAFVDAIPKVVEFIPAFAELIAAIAPLLPLIIMLMFAAQLLMPVLAIFQLALMLLAIEALAPIIIAVGAAIIIWLALQAALNWISQQTGIVKDVFDALSGAFEIFMGIILALLNPFKTLMDIASMLLNPTTAGKGFLDSAAGFFGLGSSSSTSSTTIVVNGPLGRRATDDLDDYRANRTKTSYG